MSDVCLFLSSYFRGYLETLDLLCGGINPEKLHWMQSLVLALRAGHGNPWCEQGWGGTEGHSRVFCTGFIFQLSLSSSASLRKPIQAQKNTPKPRKGKGFTGVQGDPQQGTKTIRFQPPIEVDGICVPQPMKVFGKFQP